MTRFGRRLQREGRIGQVPKTHGSVQKHLIFGSATATTMRDSIAQPTGGEGGCAAADRCPPRALLRLRGNFRSRASGAEPREDLLAFSDHALEVVMFRDAAAHG